MLRGRLPEWWQLAAPGAMALLLYLLSVLLFRRQLAN
jgi:hypothetical protein